MATTARPRPRSRSALPAAPRSPWIDSVVIPAALAAISVVAFFPALGHDFVDWDDDSNFLENKAYRGLGWTHLRWMFTSFLNGHYIPLTWMTLGLDYLVWGMTPFGYHLTNLVLHAMNTVAFYFVTRRLLATAAGAGPADARWGLPVAAAAAALLFGIHPLRAESVAWITERRDVLSGLFYLLAIVTYVRYGESTVQGDGRGRRWYWATFGFFALSLLSKSMAVSLPVVLLILDVYPLRRLSVAGRARATTSWSVLREKIPFVALSLLAGAITFVAALHTGNMIATSTLGGADRLAISAYGLAFYLWKTVVPLALSPLYELPPRIDPGAWPFLLAGTVVAIVTGLAIALRRRWPSLGAVWLSYIAILLPVLGIVQNGPQIAADRYTYLACAGWAILAGAGVRQGWRAWHNRRLATPTVIVLGGLTLSGLVGLGLLTWSQVKIWRDSETLWTHAVAAQPSAMVQFKLGVIQAHRGDFTRATERFHEALRLNPRYSRAHAALGFALLFQGKTAEATERFRDALRISPREAEAHSGLGLALERQGHLTEAAEHLRQALAANPQDAVAQSNLGRLLVRQGKLPEATVHFQEAVRIAPGSAEAHNQLGLVLAEQGTLAEAAAHFQEAARINPGHVEARQNWAATVQRQGKPTEAGERLPGVRTLRP